MNPTNDDCYFYYYSTCGRGSDCPYRHCEAALGTEIVCTLWREGRCLRPNCKFRHMESRINRSSIPCFWESQPTGCLKPHCVFLHTKKSGVNVKSASDNKSLVFPFTVQGQSNQPATKSPTDDSANDIGLSFPFQEPIKSPLLGTPTVAVEPVVVTLNDNEESDTESLNNTPIKGSSDLNTASGYQKKLFKDSDDFGIKTLEQLRMEKILKESEHFYKSAYDAPVLVTLPKLMKTENLSNNEPRNLASQMKDVSEIDIKDESASYNTALETSSLSSDLRDILKRRKNRPELFDPKPELTRLKNSEEPRKRIISLKRFASEITDEHSNITITVNKNKKEKVNDEPSAPKSIVVIKREVPEVLKELSAPKSIVVIKKVKTEVLESNLPARTRSKPKEKKNEENLRFKVKTLDEIRREKSVKSVVEEAPKGKTVRLNRRPSPKKEDNIFVSSSIPDSGIVVKEVKQMSSNTRLRVKRPAREIYQVKAVVMNNGVSPTKRGSVAADAENSPKKVKSSPPDHQNGLSRLERLSLQSEDAGSSEVPVSSQPSRRILQLRRSSVTANDNRSSKDEDGSVHPIKQEEKPSLAKKSSSLSGLCSFIRRRPVSKDTSTKEKEEPQLLNAEEREPESSDLDISFRVSKQDSESLLIDFEKQTGSDSRQSDLSDASMDESDEKNFGNNFLADSCLEMAHEQSQESATCVSEIDETRTLQHSISENNRSVSLMKDSCSSKASDRSISVEDVDTFLTEGDDFGYFDENDENSVEQTEDIFQEIEDILKS